MRGENAALRGDLYSYGRTREPAVTVGMDAPHDPEFVCSRCGCSAITGDRRLLAAIGWRIFAPEPDDAVVPALCPPCSRKAAPHR